MQQMTSMLLHGYFKVASEVAVDPFTCVDQEVAASRLLQDDYSRISSAIYR